MTEKSQKFDFEKTLIKLEKLVQELESSDTSLEKSISKYEESISLYKNCQDYLSKAQKRIEILNENMEAEDLS